MNLRVSHQKVSPAAQCNGNNALCFDFYLGGLGPPDPARGGHFPRDQKRSALGEIGDCELVCASAWHTED